MTKFYTAESDTLSIHLMSGIYPEMLKVNSHDDIRRWWEVVDRTTGEVVSCDDWSYSEETGDVTICVECVNRFETHFLNIAEDAVKFCKDVGTGNVKVHLDCFHMIREEKSFSGAVKTCGKEYLGYVHVNENDRGIPGTGLVPFKEFFQALDEIGYDGPLVIESFDPSFEELAGNCAIWRNFADTREELAIEGLKNLKAIADAM